MTNDHTVVVGGTKGLGRLVVERFLARGFDVTVLSRQPAAEHAGNARIRHLAVDLARPETIAGVWTAACAAAGPLRYLALCQRFRGQGDPWAGEIEVGLNASRALIEGFGDHFCDSGDRAIAVVSSVYARFV